MQWEKKFCKNFCYMIEKEMIPLLWIGRCHTSPSPKHWWLRKNEKNGPAAGCCSLLPHSERSINRYAELCNLNFKICIQKKHSPLSPTVYFMTDDELCLVILDVIFTRQDIRFWNPLLVEKEWNFIQVRNLFFSMWVFIALWRSLFLFGQ